MASIKKITLFVLLAVFSLRLSAQSFSFGDLFGQAGKQKNYYLQQIAAYQAFESELKQGYTGDLEKQVKTRLIRPDTGSLANHLKIPQGLVSLPPENMQRSKIKT